MRRVLIGTTALLGLALVAGSSFLVWEGTRPALLLGLGVALLLVLPSYWSLSWAIRRTDRVFYSVYAGGALGRLAGLFLTAYLVWRNGSPSLVPALLSLVFSLAALSGVEVFLLQRQSESA